MATAGAFQALLMVGGQLCTQEDFAEGLGPYVLVGGSIAPFSATTGDYGPQITVATKTGPFDAIRRSASSVVTDCRGFQVIGRVTDGAPIDDSAFVRGTGTSDFLNAAVAVLFRRETAFDGLRRPHVTWGSVSTAVGSAALTVGDWYRITVNATPLGGNLRIETTINNLTTATTIGTYSTIFGNPGPIRVDRLLIVSDGTGVPGFGYTCPTEIAFVRACSHHITD